MQSMLRKDISWQQVVICVALLAATIATYKLFGEVPAGITLALTAVVNFLMGRGDDVQKSDASISNGQGQNSDGAS